MVREKIRLGRNMILAVQKKPGDESDQSRRMEGVRMLESTYVFNTSTCG